MSIQAAIEAQLPYLQAEAEARMVDAFDIFSPGGEPVRDSDGMEARLLASEGTTRGRVSGRSSQGGDTTTRYISVAGTDRPVLEGGLHIPIGALLPDVGWEYVCTAVGAASDPALVGRRYRVVDVPAKSAATARRLNVVEVSP